MAAATEAFTRGFLINADAPDFAARVAAEALPSSPGSPPEGYLQRELEAAAVASLHAFLTDGANETASTSPVVPGPAVEFAKTLAQRRLGLSVLLNTYRSGQSSFWRDVMAYAAVAIPDADTRGEVLLRLWDQLSRWVDHQLSELSQIHETERDRFVRGALARRIETATAIIADDPLDLEHAERILSHDLRRDQTAFVLWADDPETGGDTLGRLELLAHQLAAAADAGRPLLVPAGSNVLWVWLTSAPRNPDIFRAAPALDSGLLKAALGRTRAGISGFRHSHREALSAHRVALAADQPTALTVYADVELMALVSEDVVAARSMVDHELGALSSPGYLSATLQTTALAYLDAGCNAADTARRLGVHKNTVHYRLKRVEELRGHPLLPGDTKLQLALRLARHFGWSTD